MSKEIHLHFFKTGRVRRYGYYTTLTGAACAQALLEKFGWSVKPVKKLSEAGKYYVFSEVVGHRPAINQYTLVKGDVNNIRSSR